MSREKRNYTVEFKEKAAELSYARGSVVEICRELDIPTSVLSRWRRESDTYGRNSFPGKGNPKLTDEQREIAELKKRLREPSKRWSENQAITSLIHDVFKDSFGSYGAPRIKEELSKKGYRVSRPRVARIMRSNNLFARRKRRFKVTTDSEHNYPVARNILNQNFAVFRKNQVWVSDITYIETKQGWCI